MSNLKLFHSSKHSEENAEREKSCIAEITKAVCEKAGITDFIEHDSFTVAFSGSKDDMKLMLEICTMKSGKEKYLYASVDDEASWESCDYESLDEFENAVADYIANRVNRTVKTVVEADGKKYRISSYYLAENGEWVCFEDESSDSKLFNFIASKLAKAGEKIETYKLQNENRY